MRAQAWLLQPVYARNSVRKNRIRGKGQIQQIKIKIKMETVDTI